MHDDVDVFIKKYYEQNDSDVSNIVNNISNGRVYLYRADLENTYSLLERVIDDFCQKYISFAGHLCIYVNEQNECYVEELFAILSRYEEYDVSIQIIMSHEITFDELIQECDYYISGRNLETISDLTYVALNGKKHLAGCAFPIFSENRKLTCMEKSVNDR